MATANIPNDPIAIQKLYTSRDNYANASTYVGQQQRLWYNPITNCFYVSDGNTPGGIPVGSCSNTSSGSSISVSDEGTIITANVGSFNFTGGWVTATATGNDVTVSIPTQNYIVNGNSWANIASANGNLVININNNQWTFDTTGNLSAPGNITAVGNIQGSWLIASNGNTIIDNGVSTTGNVTASYFIGNGSQLANLPIQSGTYSNANVANYLPTYSGNISGGNITLTSNVTANYRIFSGGNTVINSTISTTGNIISGNISTSGNVTANYGIFSGGNTVINSTISTTGNIIGGNISTSGNVYAGNIIGNTTYNGGYYGAFHTNYETALNGGINSNSTAPIVVTSTAGWPATGALLIDQEVISYTGITGVTFTGITRGVAGSNRATHGSGSPVSFAQVAAANTATRMVIDQTDLSSGVTVNASTHEVTIVNAGVYNCQFSVQTACADNAPDDIAVWFVVDGTAVPSSASYVTTQQIHGNHLGAAIMTVNIFYQFTAGQKLTLQWVTLAGTSVITSYSSVASPVIPSSPSVILTVNQIG